MATGDPAAPPASSSSPPGALAVGLPHLVIAGLVIASATVLCALHDVSGSAVLGLLGAALGISGTIGAANLTPNR